MTNRRLNDLEGEIKAMRSELASVQLRLTALGKDLAAISLDLIQLSSSLGVYGASERQEADALSNERVSLDKLDITDVQ